MIGITLIATLAIGIAMTFRYSPIYGLRISPIGLTVSFVSGGCLLIGEIIAHVFPIGIDDSDQIGGGRLSGIVHLDAGSTVVMGLHYGGILLIGAMPFILLFAAITRYYRLKYA